MRILKRAIALILLLGIAVVLSIEYLRYRTAADAEAFLSEIQTIRTGKTTRQEILDFAASHPRIFFGKEQHCTEQSCTYQLGIDNRFLAKAHLSDYVELLIRTTAEREIVKTTEVKVMTARRMMLWVNEDAACPCLPYLSSFGAYQSGSGWRVLLTPKSTQEERDYALSLNTTLLTRFRWDRSPYELLTVSKVPPAR